MKTIIQHFVKIKAHQVFVDAVLVYEEKDKTIPFGDFIRNVYKHLRIQYPKFYKMDNMSKLAFIAAELLKPSEASTYQNEEKGIVLMNKSSSLYTDGIHQASIEDKTNYFPSPAVFVYTLPNIAIGELCIRHDIKGENYFLVQSSFQAKIMVSYVDSLFTKSYINQCICGWLEFNEKDYEVFFYTVEQNSTNAVKVADKSIIFASVATENEHILHEVVNIEKLYKL